MKMRIDRLPYIDKDFYQDEKGYHFNSDTVLLGLSLGFKRGLKVLDIGTGSGALLLYASVFEPYLLTGIDPDEDALKVAHKNLAMHKLKYELFHTDLHSFEHDPFDVIITNPPFLQKDHSRKRFNKAMDQSALPLAELFKGMKRLLKDNGSIFMIYASEYLEQLIIKSHEYGFKIMTIRLVFDDKKKEATRVVLKLKKGRHAKTKVLKPFFIKNGKIGDF